MTFFRLRFLPVLAAFALCSGVVLAQTGNNEDSTKKQPPTPEEVGEAVEGLGDRVQMVENDVAALQRLSFGGYLQTEWQHFDQKSSLGGAALYSNSSKNLFTIRRMRLKTKYTTSNMDLVLEPDFSETGVTLKDAFGEWRILPHDLLTFKFGSFYRPNSEVETSASVLETTEETQVIRAFYPGDRDLGIMFILKKELFQNFTPKLQIGIFNGNGIASETDPYKDLITRLTFPIPLGYESPVQIDLGVSYYYGGIPQTTDTVLQVTGDTTFTKVADPINGSDTKGYGNRSNFNIEGQFYFDILPFGGTIIKGEFLTGKRPTAPTAAVAASVTTGKDSVGKDIVVIKAATPATLLKISNQMGYYFYFIQNFGADLQLVARYDFFDRNTNLANTRVKSASDAASSVITLGLNWFINKIKLGVFYEIPSFATNENIQTDAKGAVIDALRATEVKDNKTTIRFQYRF